MADWSWHTTKYDPSEYAPRMPATDYAPRLCDVLNYGYDLGLQDYPIFDETYRATLNQKIVDHFYTREIGAETPPLFIFRLNRTLRERMPQINAVYEMLAERSPLTTATSEQTSTGSGTNESSGLESTSSDAESRAYNSNTPQVSMVGKSEVDYYDTGAVNTAKNSGMSGSTSQGKSSSETHSSATQSAGHVSELIAAWYDGYNNGDLLVFDALEPCFMQVYRPGYTYW